MLDITADPDYAMVYGSNLPETETQFEADSSSQLVFYTGLLRQKTMIMATRLNAFHVFSFAVLS